MLIVPAGPFDGSPMEKKRNWFHVLKRFFGSDTRRKPEKKEKRRRWLLGRLQLRRPPALTAPPSPEEKTLSEVEEEQTKHALAVAVATAAAAEAAVAAAQAAAEVVRLTTNPRSSHRSDKDKKCRELAAIKIQSAFRGYLVSIINIYCFCSCMEFWRYPSMEIFLELLQARKALRALKGLVKLQALVRGRLTRRQTKTTLRSLQSIVKIQSEVRARREQLMEANRSFQDTEQDMKTRPESNKQRWDNGLLSKEELEAIYLSKNDAASKRQRALEYAFGRRERQNTDKPTSSIAKESVLDQLNCRWRWLEKWVDTQPGERRLAATYDESRRFSDVVAQLDMIHKNEAEEVLRKSFHKEEDYVGSFSPSFARKSFHLPKRSSVKDDESSSGSPALPSYMASTESAKARERSISMPKQRMEAIASCSDHLFPFVNSSATATIKAGKSSSPLQRSPRLKVPSGPVKSERSFKDLSVDSACSLLNWDRRGTFR
ncbi:hypothetical protein ACLOJK_000400 [Asimina triloba]